MSISALRGTWSCSLDGRWYVAGLALLVAACQGPTGASVGSASRALGGVGVPAGEHLFTDALPHTNGRACATCHIPTEDFALSPQHVNDLYATNPSDPLFSAVDADDPNAAVLTFDHLKAGLIRVTIKLADNLDVIDGAGNVITNADRTISVWRGVPTIENTVYTAPYQYDSRAPDYEVQAAGALTNHSQITQPAPEEVIDLIAVFEGTIFSDAAAAGVAGAIAAGQNPPPVDVHAPPGSDAAEGQKVFLAICTKCHDTPKTNTIVDKAVFDSFFPVQHADGTVDVSGFLPTGIAVVNNFRHDLAPPHEGTYGISVIAMLGQLGALPNPSGLSLPQYRIRFYTDATRTQQLVDLPPPVPGIGPSLVPQPFSVDPGRSIVSGDPYDWEGFKVPQLRGVARTAPYFHDASAPDLHALLDEYSRLILPADPVLGLPPIFPPEGPGLPPESLTPQQKAQLFAFLQLL
jgi:hypothetical protein